MPSIKVKVTKDFKNQSLKEILPLNYHFEITPILSTEPKVIHRGSNENGSSKNLPIFPRVIAPIGNYEGFTFIGANGLTYSDKTISSVVGYNWTIDEYFEKL